MIKTVLIDDEMDSILVLRRMLEMFCPQVSIVGTANGVESALEVIGETDPDLVILDIEMTQGNAFDLLNQLQPIPFEIIFVTAFDSYALRAFKYSALDYLLKPVNIDELCNAIARVSERPGRLDLSRQMQLLLENVGALQLNNQKIAIPTLTGLIFVAVHDILRFEAKGNYTTIYLSGGEAILATRTIKEYEEMLPDSIFYRVHNSHIINLTRIREYQKGRGGSIVMEDGTIVEVASRRRDDFLRKLFK